MLPFGVSFAFDLAVALADKHTVCRASSCSTGFTLNQNRIEDKDMDKRQLAYSKKEAAAVTSLSLRGIDYLIEKGQLKAVKVGRRVIIPAQELEKLVFNGAASVILGENRASA